MCKIDSKYITKRSWYVLEYLGSQCEPSVVHWLQVENHIVAFMNTAMNIKSCQWPRCCDTKWLVINHSKRKSQRKKALVIIQLYIISYCNNGINRWNFINISWQRQKQNAQKFSDLKKTSQRLPNESQCYHIRLYLLFFLGNLALENDELKY